jgi:2-deoxy-D-gluconate 3-dehydrogenase
LQPGLSPAAQTVLEGELADYHCIPLTKIIMSILSKFSLAGKTALVTGCKRGIGKSIAVALAEAGADIIGVSASLELTGSKVQQEVEATGRSFKAYQADFNDRKALYTFIDKVKGECAPVDILFCNAGTIMRKPAAEHPDEYWDEVINVNLNAQFILSREFGKDMIQRENGKIIFTASLLSFQGGITVPGYAASKGAIARLTMALRNDPERAKSILSRIPAGRWGEGEDMKGAAVYLASPASDYVTGTIITVDGGWMGR